MIIIVVVVVVIDFVVVVVDTEFVFENDRRRRHRRRLVVGIVVGRARTCFWRSPRTILPRTSKTASWDPAEICYVLILLSQYERPLPGRIEPGGTLDPPETRSRTRPDRNF